MITLQQIFDDLTYGYLAQTSLGDFDADEYESSPDPRNYAQLTSYVNQGLLELYKRFFLSSKEIDIQQYEQITSYILDSKYAVSNVASVEPVKWIEDSSDYPFQDDILKIEEVYDEEGNKLPLNKDDDEDSVFTPNYKTIQISEPNANNMVSVQYRAAHPRIEYAVDFDPETEEIMLPLSLYDALLQYVAFKVFQNTGLGGEAKSSSFYQMFEKSCMQVEEYGLEVQTDTTADARFVERGWC